MQSEFAPASVGESRLGSRRSRSRSGEAPAAGVAMRRALALLATVIAGGVVALALGTFVIRTDAGMEYDDAVYLERGLYHAAQVSERGNLLLPRLAWSLGFEAPKPPLYHGLLALATLVFGRERIGAVLVAGALVPLLALAAALAAFARRIGGARAAALALAAYLAMPAALLLGTRLLTETTLAATVVGGTFFAWRRARGGGLVDELAVGLLGGLSLLAKLLGPLFLGPAILVATVECARIEGWRRAVRFAAVAAGTALLVAGPWYFRNGGAALAFAHVARSQESSLYTGSWWMRPLDFVRSSAGWPLAIALLLLLAVRVRAAAGGDTLLPRMVVAAAAVSALVIGAQPMFDARFWLPAAALVAVWAGVELAGVWRRARASWRPALAAAVAALVAVNVYGLLATPRPQMPWRAVAVVGRLASETTSAAPPVLCTLGNNLDWNTAKLRLLAELSGVRPRPEVADVLTEGRAADVAGKLDRCDAVFALRPDQIPSVANQRALNADLALAWLELHRRADQLRSDAAAAAALGSRARPAVLLRRQSN